MTVRRLFAALCAAVVMMGMMQGVAEAQPGGGRRPGGYNRPMVPQSQQQVGFRQMGMLVGTIVLTDGDGEEYPGTGVTVIASFDRNGKRDSLYTTGDQKGYFYLMGVPAGKARVEFSMMGYETLSKTMDVQPGENRIVANLHEETFLIQQAVVRETVEPLTIKQDTLVFNASAVKTNKGEKAIDILEQMPGVEVGDNGVKILNEDLATVYVDGALLFGSAPMKALEQLPAEEVIKMRSYQEYANKDPNHQISKTESKQRVLDIETKSKSKLVYNGIFRGGIGADTDTTYHKMRYTTGVMLSAFSESLQAGLMANVNNINDNTMMMRGATYGFGRGRGSNSPDLRAISISGSLTKRWMSPTTRNFELGSISANYSYTNNYNIQESRSEKIYFANENYDSRRNETSSYSKNTSGAHTFGLMAAKSLKDGRLTLNTNYSLNTSGNESERSNYNYQDDLKPQGSTSTSKSSTSGHSFTGGLGYEQGFNNKIRVNASVSYNDSFTNTGTAKIDSLSTTISRQVLDIDANSVNQGAGAKASLRYEINPNSAISAEYSFSNTFSQKEQMAYDISLGEEGKFLDLVNTEKLTQANNSHVAKIEYVNHFDAIDANFNVGLSYSSVGLDRNVTYPDEEIYGKTFDYFTPTVSLRRESMLGKWSISYDVQNQIPSLEQVRPKINNTNLYSVSVGNTALTQSLTHNFRAAYSTAPISGMEGGFGQMMAAMFGVGQQQSADGKKVNGTFSMSANFSVGKSPIVRKESYFAQETFLPAYNYTMPAQSTLSTYENSSENTYHASGRIGYDRQINAIMCIVGASASMSWDKSPQYIQQTLTITENMRPTVNLRLRSNFSRNFRFNLDGSGSYIYSFNDLSNKTEYFTETLRAGMELNNIFKIFYASGDYSKVFTQGIQLASINDNILNLNAGARFGKSNNWDVSVRVNDVFNKNTGFSTSMTADYVSNSWVHNFGRYVLFNITYNFTSLKSTDGPSMVDMFTRRGR